jgi:hypothetical protein
VKGQARWEDKVKQNAKNKKGPEAIGKGVLGAKAIQKKGIFGRFISFF